MTKIITSAGELTLLALQAEAPVQESWSFLTSVLTSQDGSENRTQMRSRPRVTISYSIPVKSQKMAETFNVAYGSIRKKWAVPLWTEAQKLVQTLRNGDTFIPCDVKNYCFEYTGSQYPSLALVYVSNTASTIVQITEIVENGINIVDYAGGELQNAMLLPIRIGRVSGSIERSTNGHNAKLGFTFELEDNPSKAFFTSEENISTYQGIEVVTENPLLSGKSDSRSIEMQEDLTDQDLGPVFSRTTWQNARYSTPVRSILDTHAAIKEYKCYLFRRMGKFSEYWAPTFEQNMRVLSQGDIGTSMQISSDSYRSDGAQRKHIAILTTEDTWLFREIVASTQATSTSVQLTLDQDLGIHARDIVYVSYLGLNRLDTDKIEIEWVGNGVATTSMRATEIEP